jgi:nucleotide-binding universal stress UspA family protein
VAEPDAAVVVEEDGREAHAGDGEEGKLVRRIPDAAREIGPDQGKGIPQATSTASSRALSSRRACSSTSRAARSRPTLGNVVELSREDLRSMGNEYKRWTTECEKQQLALGAEKRQTEQQLQELGAKLEELNKDVDRQESKLRSVKAAAFLNEVDLTKQFTPFCASVNARVQFLRRKREW